MAELIFGGTVYGGFCVGWFFDFDCFHRIICLVHPVKNGRWNKIRLEKKKTSLQTGRDSRSARRMRSPTASTLALPGGGRALPAL